MRCVNLVEVITPPKWKSYANLYKHLMVLASGVFFIAGGVLSFTVCVTYANGITGVFEKQDYLKRDQNWDVMASVRQMYEMKQIIGVDLWKGWSAGFVLVLVGIFVLVVSRKRKRKENLNLYSLK